MCLATLLHTTAPGGAMFVIFGWGFTTTRVFGAVFPIICPHCHNERMWILQRVRRWFTLFFIPIFPYTSVHALLCPICGAGHEMSGDDLRRARLLAETNTAYEAGALSDADHMRRLGAIAEASDEQVRKGLSYVLATSVVDTITAPVESCARCGRDFDSDGDAFCPRCGTRRPEELTE